MKKLKTIFLTAAAVMGIGGSIFGAQHHNFTGTTYYAVTDDAGGWTWSTTAPNPTVYECQSSMTTACAIVVQSGYTPVRNQMPPNSVIIIIVDPNGRWKRI